MRKSRFLFLLFSFAAICGYSQQISLAGKWRVQLDEFDNKIYTVNLPGTLDDAGIGYPVQLKPALDIATLAHLARKVQYTGKASYSRSFRVPLSWKAKQVKLILARVIWKSTVMIDGKQVPGTGESLVAPHEFDLTDLIIPGKNQTITICIDNRDMYPGINIEGKNYPAAESREMTHAYTNHTQIKWNGILGEITLVAKPEIRILKTTIFSDLAKKELQIGFQWRNPANKNVQLSAYVTDLASGKKWPVSIRESTNTNQAEAIIPFAKNVRYWDEFSPSLYQLTSIVQSGSQTDTGTIRFGIRSLKVENSNLTLNDHRIFIRGNLECVIFPLTGYPPMQEKEWLDLYKKAKSYGLNSFRFHSWCPPEAAFAAADRAGFYLQAELPHWNLKVGNDTAAFHFLEREAYRILDKYGHHPSFMFFSMGNELEGDFGKLNNLVSSLKKTDNRHLYATTTFTFQKGITRAPQPQDDYFVTQQTKKGWIRGQGIFNDQSPDFSTDYSHTAGGLDVPVISHEIGQYSVYPDMKEMTAYTGNLRPINFLAIKNDLEKKGLLPIADKFLLASGKFAALLYKEEIERALKTKEFDGFQLLQLQDFPGQGTALVGLLNAFWKSKGVISAAAFREFCSEVVPLVRFPKAVYTNREIFKAGVELANFYKPLPSVQLHYSIANEAGNILQSGSFDKQDFPVGNGLAAGEINFDLQKIKVAQKLTITVNVSGTRYTNSWPIWVYPANLKTEAPVDITLTGSKTEAMQALKEGRKVLLCPAPDTLNGITGKFVPVFWSPVHFPDQPGTMGLSIQSKHKAFEQFPTDDHSNWQWWDLTIRSKALQAGNLPDAANIVRPIDNFVRNNNLSSVFEAKVLRGQLIFCSFDIINDLDNRPQAKQLRYSLLKYMHSIDFKPSFELKEEDINNFFK